VSELVAVVLSIGLIGVGLVHSYRYVWRVPTPDTSSERRLSRVYRIAIAVAIGLGLLGTSLAMTSGAVVRLFVVTAVLGWMEVVRTVKRRLDRELGIERRSLFQRLIENAR